MTREEKEAVAARLKQITGGTANYRAVTDEAILKKIYSTFLSIAEEEIGNRPFLSIYGDQGGIRIPRSAVTLFGHPKNICFMIDKKYESIALMPCEEKHPMSTMVPDKIYTDKTNICVRYHCTDFVKDLLFMNELEEEKAYLVFGKYDKEKQRVIYKMRTAIDVVSLQIGQTSETPVVKRTGT